MKKGNIMALLLTISLLAFSGCSSAAPSQTDASSKKVDTTQTTSATQTKSKQITSTANKSKQAVIEGRKANLVPATVAKDVDGDTIKISLNGKIETIRMLLIDTPEDVDPQKPVEPFGFQAAGYAKSVLPVGKHIYLELGKPGYERDKYNRLLAYIYITPTDMYNIDVVAKGLARVAYIYPPNTDHLSDLQSAESKAKSENLGIWSLSGYVTPNGYNLTQSCEYAKKNGYSTKGCSTITLTNPKSSWKTTSYMALKASASSATSVSGTLNITHGDEASVTIKTKPGATGMIEVDYKSGPSKAKGLEPKIADSNGTITWTWRVGTNTTPGTYPIIITVNGRVIQKTLTVN